MNTTSNARAGHVARMMALLTVLAVVGACAQRQRIYEAAFKGDYAMLNCVQLETAQLTITQRLSSAPETDRRMLLTAENARIGELRGAQGCPGGVQPVAQTPAKVLAATVPQLPVGQRFLQVATFRVPSNTRKTVERLRQLGFEVETRPATLAGVAYDRVIIGPLNSRAEIARADAEITRLGFMDAFFVQ